MGEDEGELKKRIESILKGDDWFRTWHDQPYNLCDEKILPIVDEAKKDMLENKRHFITETTDTFGEPDFICIDYKKWKKWFGS